MQLSGRRFLLSVLLWGFSSAGVLWAETPRTLPQQPDSVLAQANQLMDEKTVPSLTQAARLYKEILEQEPDNFEALRRIALAYCRILDIKTSALRVEKDEYQPLLKDLGGKADRYARRALELKPDSKEAIQTALAAYGYYSASFGIAKSVFGGVVGRFKELANKLIELDDSFEGACGYKALGRFYYIAPWPVGSSSKSEELYLKALAKLPGLLEAHYYLGLIFLDKGEREQARREFEFVVNKPPYPTETHYIADFKTDAAERLKRLTNK
jgi:tetratricopeptide (TPR) repeat protein